LNHRASVEASVGTSGSSTTSNALQMIILCGVFGGLGYAAQRFVHKKNAFAYEQMKESEMI